jgi:ribosomal protein S18 acetylase RimI-like enzyme
VPFTVHQYASGEPIDADVAKLLVDVFVGEHYSPRRGAAYLTAAALSRRGMAWVARANDTSDAVGTVFLVTPDNAFRQIAVEGELEVHLLAVRPSARRQGVADALLTACLAEARRQQTARVVLSTQPVMIAAQRLYEKHGFVRAPERDWRRADERSFLAYQLHLYP